MADDAGVAGPQQHARAAAAGYVVATFLSFPHLVGERVVDLGLWVSWLGPAFLWLAVRGAPPLRAARRGFLVGLIAQSAILHWIYVVTVVYGEAPAVVGVIAPVALAVYTALFVAAFAAWAAWTGRGGIPAWLLPVVLAAGWAALDHGRSFFLTGWPWSTLGYAQHQNGWLLGLARSTGVYGLSFATALGGFGLAEAGRMLVQRRPPPAGAWWALAGVAALHLCGWLALPALDPAPGRQVRVAALQGNIDQGVKWRPGRLEEIVSVYAGLAQRAADAGAQIVLWPETAVPGLLELDSDTRERLERLARQTGAVHVIGAVGSELDASRTRIASYRDSAFVLSAEGRWLDRYDKTHLVPFGEYVPLRGVFGWLISAVARGVAPTDVVPGAAPRALELPVRTPEGVEHLRLGVPICYELLFPDLVRRFVADGGGGLLSITNDAWYGRTGAPYQFLAITALRSAETGVWGLRAANTGISALIDPAGRVREETGIFEEGLLVADLPLPERGAPSTFYVAHGDVFAWGCWLASALCAGAVVRRHGGNSA